MGFGSNFGIRIDSWHLWDWDWTRKFLGLGLGLGLIFSQRGMKIEIAIPLATSAPNTRVSNWQYLSDNYYYHIIKFITTNIILNEIFRTNLRIINVLQISSDLRNVRLWLWRKFNLKLLLNIIWAERVLMTCCHFYAQFVARCVFRRGVRKKISKRYFLLARQPNAVRRPPVNSIFERLSKWIINVRSLLIDI